MESSTIPTINSVVPTDFGIPYDEFVESLKREFDPTFEHDSSFGFFRHGESVSGQVGANEKDLLQYVELHQCHNRRNFTALLNLLPGEHRIGIQIMEQGVFCHAEHYELLLS